MTAISRLFSRRGAIIIEFAFSIPVFIALIYYLHDVPKLQRYQQQMDFVAQQVAQMLQNVSQQRTNKRITRQDMINVVRAAYLTIFPGISMLAPKKDTIPLGFFVHCLIYYIKGEPNGKASTKWVLLFYITQGPYVNVSIYKDISGQQSVAPSVISPSLTIKNGEVKMLVVSELQYAKPFSFADGRKCRDVSFREAFGFLIHDPRPYDTNGHSHTDLCNFFTSHTIFTPAAGLFDETRP